MESIGTTLAAPKFAIQSLKLTMNDTLPPSAGKTPNSDAECIVSEYEDYQGKFRRTDQETQSALLRSMSLDPDTPRKAKADVQVVGQREVVRFDGESTILLEDGSELRATHQTPPDLPCGYHRLCFDDSRQDLFLIKRPDSGCVPVVDKTWGWSVQLYAARSKHSWGMGDFSDLKRLAQWSGQLGAGAIFVNPLCAGSPANPQQPSPYLPDSRRYRNPLYIDVMNVPNVCLAGYPDSLVGEQARNLNLDRQIDRDRVFEFKMDALKQLWQHNTVCDEFEKFCIEHGRSLQNFATYIVLAEHHGADWRKWPEKFRHPRSAAVNRFGSDHIERVRFHKWLQWILDVQLADAAAQLPLVNDLPIGFDPAGADAWEWQEFIAADASVGAPPDSFSVDGQDWGFPPFIPHKLEESFYAPFIETIRSSLRHAGGLRMDHAMGLFRLFWIPRGQSARRGAYVRYPADELLAIVAIESHRAGAWIAGEDLGTVEPSVREKLLANGMLSYRLLWFEDSAPCDYPGSSIASVSTHDLPTIAGLWSGVDFENAARIGLHPDRSSYAQMRRRLEKSAKLCGDDSTEAAVLAAYRSIGESPSAVVTASLEDALLVSERPNMPGTVEEWPNWSLALPQSLEEVEVNPVANRLANAIAGASRNRSQSAGSTE